MCLWRYMCAQIAGPNLHLQWWTLWAHAFLCSILLGSSFHKPYTRTFKILHLVHFNHCQIPNVTLWPTPAVSRPVETVECATRVQRIPLDLCAPVHSTTPVSTASSVSPFAPSWRPIRRRHYISPLSWPLGARKTMLVLAFPHPFLLSVSTEVCVWIIPPNSPSSVVVLKAGQELGAKSRLLRQVHSWELRVWMVGRILYIALLVHYSLRM